jgi:hypothetical protein
MTKTQELASRADNFTMINICAHDYPDFCDAFIDDCDIDGRPATIEELDLLNEDGELLNALAREHFVG